MIQFERFTNLSELNEWNSKHLEFNIINIETETGYPLTYKVWYWYNRYGNL